MTQRPAVLLSEDLSGVGGVSMTAALPLLTVLDVMPCALPTALLSTHTGGLGANTMLDLAPAMPGILTHWQTLDLAVQAVVIGYLSQPAMAVWRQWLPRVQAPLRLVDPVMGDHGRLYRGFDAAAVASMRQLVQHATLITPNVTEAQALLDQPLTAGPWPVAQAQQLAAAVAARFGVAVVLTGVPLADGAQAVVGHTAAGAFTHTLVPVPGDYFGTGDIFTSVLAGALVRGQALEAAVTLAETFIHKALVVTHRRRLDPRLGVAYAAALPWLLTQIPPQED
ncbi:PfkB family carbohydrate kinase [Lacticaseibacillus daqingensis]|uniref:PfkB family carbohydrate kinase n=1 Tax=Lacticaseibacillus daqingensis TaxID=2486014 RepID=UPI000F76E234|nr:PfkB family carbohydrate kinase [Lacticaseibacillus daqingensis]